MKEFGLKDLLAVVDSSEPVLTVKINGLPGDVYVKEQAIFQARYGNDDITYFGLAAREREELWIGDGIRTNERMRKTIMHELTHAVIDSYGLSQWETFREENLADFMESYGDEIVALTDQIYDAIMAQRKEE